MTMIQTLSPIAKVEAGKEMQQPDAIASETIVFCVTICFLAAFGKRR